MVTPRKSFEQNALPPGTNPPAQPVKITPSSSSTPVPGKREEDVICRYCRKSKPISCFSNHRKGKMNSEKTLMCDICREKHISSRTSLKIRRSAENRLEDRYKAVIKALRHRIATRTFRSGVWTSRLSRRDIIRKIMDSISFPDRCPYLNVELIYFPRPGDRLDNVFSIDRIDSTIGYEPGNVQILSKLANVMKNNATDEQLLTFARNILRIHTKET